MRRGGKEREALAIWREEEVGGGGRVDITIITFGIGELAQEKAAPVRGNTLL